MHLARIPDDLIDVTNTSGGFPKGLYMDNTGLGSGTVTASYIQHNTYVDWWITTASNSTNPFTYSQHYVLRAGDPGIHVYFVVIHGTNDIAGSLGQIQFVFRVNLTLFPNTYAVNTGLNNIGAVITPLLGPPLDGVTDPGRQVQDATVDLHGLPWRPAFGASSIPSTTTRAMSIFIAPTESSAPTSPPGLSCPVTSRWSADPPSRT